MARFDLKSLLVWVTCHCVLFATGGAGLVVYLNIIAATYLGLNLAGKFVARYCNGSRPPFRRWIRRTNASFETLYWVGIGSLYMFAFWVLFVTWCTPFRWVPSIVHMDVGSGISISLLQHAIFGATKVLILVTFFGEAYATGRLQNIFAAAFLLFLLGVSHLSLL